MTQNEFNVVLEQQYRKCSCVWHTRRKNTPETALTA